MSNSRSISIVDYKVAQTEYFLSRVDVDGYDIFAVQCNCDAFATAARSITFAVQAVCRGIPGFDEWYAVEQEAMKECPLCRFFNDYRRISNHIGESPIKGGYSDPQSPGRIRHLFVSSPDLLNIPEPDVVKACSAYFSKCVDLVYRLYTIFRNELDERWYFTRENYGAKGLSIEDAEEALGFPRGWTRLNGSEEELRERWQVLQRTQTIGPQIQHIFQKYVGKMVAGPDDNGEHPSPPQR